MAAGRVRAKTRVAGDSSRTATLMRRYGVPQMTLMATNSSQPRRVIPLFLTLFSS